MLELLVVDVRDRQHLGHLHAGDLFQLEAIGGLMHAAAHQQVADHGPGSFVRCHLVDARLVRACAGLQEEIVQEVHD